MTASNRCFQNILLGTDFSDAAAIGVDTAFNLAQRCGAKLTVAHVVPEASASFAMIDYGSEAAWMPAADDVKRLQQNLWESAAQRLHELAAEIKKRGVTIETEVLIGIPYESLSEAVKAKEFDLVVVGTRGMSAIKRVLVGSTATRLARTCPVPVWVARHPFVDEAASVLAAVDFSPVSEQVVVSAASLAAALNAKLHVLHVYDTEELYGAPTISEATRAEFSYYRRRVRRDAFWKLEQLAGATDIDHHSVTFHVAQGRPYQVINSTARRLDAGLVVMGSVGRRGLSALLIGNTAEKVLHTSDRSLLVIKPQATAVRLLESDTNAVALSAAT
jgi:universal stress protein E